MLGSGLLLFSSNASLQDLINSNAIAFYYKTNKQTKKISLVFKIS